VRALVAFAAVSGPYEPPRARAEQRLMERTSVGNWLLRFMVAHAPTSTVTATLKAEGDLSTERLKALVAEVMADDHARQVVLTMAAVVGDDRHRRAGVENDLAQFRRIESLQLERIATPTLVVVGAADTDVPPAHSAHAAATIAGAESVVMAEGTHLSLFAHPDAPAIQARVVAKLR
jgi:pimeloyl-ACP methyl ester carboxylesterase